MRDRRAFLDDRLRKLLERILRRFACPPESFGELRRVQALDGERVGVLRPVPFEGQLTVPAMHHAPVAVVVLVNGRGIVAPAHVSSSVIGLRQTASPCSSSLHATYDPP